MATRELSIVFAERSSTAVRKINKLKWYGILFALFVLFLYVIGIYDLFMVLSHNEAYYAGKNYGQTVKEYFTNYPVVLLIFWVGNLVCGLLGPVLYLCKKRNAYTTVVASFLCDFILIILGAVFRNRIDVLGTNIFCFDLFILLVTLLFAIFLYVQTRAAR